MPGLITSLLGVSEGKEASLKMSSGIVLPSLVGVASVLFAHKWWYAYVKSTDKPWKMVPGRWFLLGHVPHFGSNERITEVLEGWADEHGQETGCFEIAIGPSKIVVICKEGPAREVLKHRPVIVERMHKISSAVNAAGVTGLLSAEGDQWKQEHKLVSATLNKKSVSDYLTVFKRIAPRLITKWKNECREGRISNVEDDLAGAMADSITNVSMDLDFDFVNEPKSQMAVDVQNAVKGIIARAFAPFSYWKIPIIGNNLDGIQSIVDRIFMSFNKRIHEIKSEVETSSGDDPQSTRSTFVHKLYQVMKSEKSHLTPERVIGNVMTLIFAGTDTTTRALTCVFYLLAQDETLQEELREEACEFDLKSASTHDLYTKLPRLKSFLHEVHRWYNNPFLGLEVTRDIPVAGSIMPKGSHVFVMSRYMSISPMVTPPKDVPPGPRNAPHTEFCPRRWLVETKDGSKPALSTTSPSSYNSTGFMGFGFGQRSCPGRHYSESLSYCILVEFLQTFGPFTLAPGVPKDAKFITNVLMVPDCKVRLSLQVDDKIMAQ